MLQCVCAYCAAEFEIRETYKKYYEKRCIPSGLYCTVACFNQHRRAKRPVKDCSTCGKPVTRNVAGIRSVNIYCSRSCASKKNNQLRRGDKHPNWKGGYTSYRKQALRYYGSTCSNDACPIRIASIDIPEALLDVDHINPDRSDNSIENLQVLCVWCHAIKTRREWGML